MKTLFSIVLLVIYGGVGGFLVLVASNIAGLPGVLIANIPGRRTKQCFILGTAIAAIGQSYVNLAFVSLMVSWTHLAAQRDDVLGLLVWPIAFLAVQCATFKNFFMAAKEAGQQKIELHAPSIALYINFFVTLVAFPLFAFVPALMKAWAYFPMVSRATGGN